MKVKYLFMTFALTLTASVVADEYQEQSCSNFSKNIKSGDIIPKSCTDIFKTESDFFKQVGSKNQNLGVWIKNNLIYIFLEKKVDKKWESEEKLIGGKELSSGQVIDMDISPSPLFDNTFEIHLLIEEGTNYHMVTYLSSQRNGQKPRVATFAKAQDFTKIFRGKDRKIWLLSSAQKAFSMNSAADSFSKNQADHPIVNELPYTIKEEVLFITSTQDETLILSQNKVISLQNGLKKTYALNDLKSLSKYEIKDMYIAGEDLLINTGGSEYLKYSIQTAVK